jgi:DNA polymerase (family 10)
VRIRELAQKKGLSLSEQALMDGQGEETLYDSEEKVYAALGFPWIPPELREDRGEVQAAKAGHLPVLLELTDIRAELHAHSTWSNGTETIEGMAQAARGRGYKVLAITDHSGGLGIANGLSVERLRQQKDAIRAAQEKMGDSIRLLHGTEVDILADGNIYYPDEVLAELDIVIASLHASLRQPRDVITVRLLKAIHNPHVDIIGHPSGRLLPDREGADLDWDAVLAGAKESGVALEINADPVRLDLDEVYARRAAEMGIVMSINTDAHSIESLEHMEYGVAVARRAWCGPGSVLNAWPVEKLLGWLKKRG